MEDDLYFIITKAKLEDIEEIKNCNFSTLPENYSPLLYIKWVTEEEHFYVVKSPYGELMGYIFFELISSKKENCKRYHLSSFAIKNRYQSLGIGKELLNYSIDKINSQKNVEITLNVRKEKNKRAIKLYKSVGFTIEEICKEYYEDKEDGYLMVLKN